MARTVPYLFDLYAANWHIVKQQLDLHVGPDGPDAFLCPLCFTLFPREALAHPNVLTLEHIPPDSLGGLDRDCTLTCARCNNTAGSRLDKSLGLKLRTDEFLLGLAGASVMGTYTSPGARPKLPMTLRRGPSGVWEIIGVRKSPKAGVHEVEQAFAATLRWQLTWRGANHKHANVALLRIAYLIAFRTFGYGLLMHEHYRRAIRRQCLDHDHIHVLPTWGVWSHQVSELSEGVYAISEPEQVRAFMVVFSLDTGLRRTRHGIILPSTTQNGLQVYSWLQEWAQQNPPLAITTTLQFIPEKEDLLRDPELAFFSWDIWASC